MVLRRLGVLEAGGKFQNSSDSLISEDMLLGW